MLESAGSDDRRRRLNTAWRAWSGEFKSARPLLQEEFANSASNNIKRQASYEDLKRLLNESGINNKTTKSLKNMVNIYEEYLYNKDNVYNSRSERDIRSREFIRESTLEQLKDIARKNPNAKGAFEVLFSSFLRED